MPSKYPEAEGYKVVSIPLADIYFDNEFNCRGDFSPATCIELANSIREHGLQTPVTVQPAEELKDVPEGYPYRLVAGHRRYTAINVFLKWESIPAYIAEGLGENDAKVYNFLENIERKNLTFEQEAVALQKAFPAGTSKRQMSKALNKSDTWCEARLAYLKLPDSVKKMYEQGMLRVVDLRRMAGKTEREIYAIAKELTLAHLTGRNANESDVFLRYKRSRKRSEIEEMLADLVESYLYPCPYKALKWAAGHIDNDELIESCYE